MTKPLVSIITPCYNGEKTAHRMIESVLSQTYSPIEYIFINDGSTDKTEELFKSYLPKFEEKGIKVIYEYQENAGQSSAVNRGLKLFTGDYLSWADSDDFLFPESVEKRVEFLESHPDYACVQSDAYMVKENDIDNPYKRISEGFPHSANENQFELCLTGQCYIGATHCFMVRRSAFLEAIPSLNIYTGRKEQNWQLFLPIYYKHKRYFLNEPLCSYVVSQTSHSHSKLTTEKAIDRANGYIDILSHTLKSIDMPKEERDRYMNIVLNIYARKKLYLCVDNGDKILAKKELETLKKIGTVKFRDKFAYAAVRSNLIKAFYKLAKKVF